jgi:hypothetical protein
LLLDFPHRWDDSLRFLAVEGNPILLVRLLQMRPELASPQGGGEGADGEEGARERAAAANILLHFKRKLDECIAAAADAVVER